MNQNQNQRYECRMAFKSTSECACGILRGMKSVWTSPGIHAVNQRYEARVGFPGHEPGRVRHKTAPTGCGVSGSIDAI